MSDLKTIPLTERQHRLLMSAIAKRDAALAEIQAMLSMVCEGPMTDVQIPADEPVIRHR